MVEKLQVAQPYIDGRTFITKTDYRVLQWLQTQTRLSKWQVGWVEQLQELDMTIEYEPGKTNTVADILLRRPDYASNCPRCHAKIPVSEYKRASGVFELGDLHGHIWAHIEGNRYVKSAWQRMIDLPNSRRACLFELRDSLLNHGDHLYIPDCEIRQELLASDDDMHHRSAHLTGLLSKKYFWPRLAKDCRA